MKFIVSIYLLTLLVICILYVAKVDYVKDVVIANNNANTKLILRAIDSTHEALILSIANLPACKCGQ